MDGPLETGPFFLLALGVTFGTGTAKFSDVVSGGILSILLYCFSLSPSELESSTPHYTVGT
jgi:hypothetical protein